MYIGCTKKHETSVCIALWFGLCFLKIVMWALFPPSTSQTEQPHGVGHEYHVNCEWCGWWPPSRSKCAMLRGSVSRHVGDVKITRARQDVLARSHPQFMHPLKLVRNMFFPIVVQLLPAISVVTNIWFGICSSCAEISVAAIVVCMIARRRISIGFHQFYIETHTISRQRFLKRKKEFLRFSSPKF